MRKPISIREAERLHNYDHPPFKKVGTITGRFVPVEESDMTMPDRCPLCGCEGDADVTGKRFCTYAKCGLPEKNWPAVQALKAERDKLKKIIATASGNEADSFDWSFLREMDELEQENARLKSELAAVRGFVSSLPHTNNGFPIAIGLKVACPRGHIHEMRPSDSLGGGIYCCSGECWSEGCQGDSGSGTRYQLNQCKAVHPLYAPDRKEADKLKSELAAARNQQANQE